MIPYRLGIFWPSQCIYIYLNYLKLNKVGDKTELWVIAYTDKTICNSEQSPTATSVWMCSHILDTTNVNSWPSWPCPLMVAPAGIHSILNVMHALTTWAFWMSPHQPFLTVLLFSGRPKICSRQLLICINWFQSVLKAKYPNWDGKQRRWWDTGQLIKIGQMCWLLKYFYLG